MMAVAAAMLVLNALAGTVGIGGLAAFVSGVCLNACLNADRLLRHVRDGA